jgi:plasmid stability protein
MSKMIQIRNVPDALHRKLKARAALAGRTLSDYLLEEVRRVADRPTLAEVLQRLSTLEPVRGGPSSEQIIREERDSR